MAARRLLERLGAIVVEAAAIVDLPDLGGSRRIADSGLPVHCVLSFGATEGDPR